jgi:hypothetical protein
LGWSSNALERKNARDVALPAGKILMPGVVIAFQLVNLPGRPTD